jgi:hypothetical protein
VGADDNADQIEAAAVHGHLDRRDRHDRDHYEVGGSEDGERTAGSAQPRLDVRPGDRLRFDA